MSFVIGMALSNAVFIASDGRITSHNGIKSDTYDKTRQI